MTSAQLLNKLSLIKDILRCKMDTKDFITKLSWCIAKYSDPNNRVATTFTRYVKKNKNLNSVEIDCVNCYIKYISGKQESYNTIMNNNIVIVGDKDHIKFSVIYSLCEDKTVAIELLVLFCKIVLKIVKLNKDSYKEINDSELLKLKEQCSWNDTTETDSESTETDSESTENEVQNRMHDYITKVYLSLGDEVQEAIFGSKQPPPDGIKYISK